MLSLTARRRLDGWEESIRPGPVGSVGDALVTSQLKSSLPGDFRWSPLTKGKKEMRLGSNVQDGEHPSFDTGGEQPRVYDNFFGGERDSITSSRGWKFQNITAEDMALEPIMGSLPRYSWRTQKATINNAAKSGEKFSKIPGPYKLPPGEVPRGGTTPSGLGRAQYLNTRPEFMAYGQQSIAPPINTAPEKNRLVDRAPPRIIPGMMSRRRMGSQFN